ncbi:MAG: c-type cytochrome, partial [Pseudomonadales bacterium]
NTPVLELAKDAQAMRVGKRIFSNNCATCHMIDGAGAKGYPNLTDDDWLWGSSPEQIKATLVNGRIAAMPAWESVLGMTGLDNMTRYLLSLSQNAAADKQAATETSDSAASSGDTGEEVVDRGMLAAKQQYAALCSVCHGAEGEGNIAFGAPRLNDDIWLYGGSAVEIRHGLANGRNGVMPAQADILSEEKIHLLTAYVYQLSRQ